MTSHSESAAEVFGLSNQDRRAIETLYRAFSDHDPSLLDQAVSPDWEDIPRAPHQQPGREGMKPIIKEFIAAFPDVTVKIHEIIGVPGRAAVRAEIAGTHAGEWFGVAPTGKRFVFPIHEFHRMENGLVTHTWHLEDWLGWMNQVGAAGAARELSR
ncbi:MAG: ester cyclase [Steroidobacteraceae bacterium]